MNRLWPAALIIGFIVTSISGCGLFRSDSLAKVPGPRIAKVIDRLPELELEPAVKVEASQADVLAAYRSVYRESGEFDEPQGSSAKQNQVLGRRLADLEMLRAQDRDASGELVIGPDELANTETPRVTPYAPAKDLYTHLLANAQHEDRAQILYQLAQADDLAGDQESALDYLDQLIAEHGGSEHYLEARFRRAEMHFSNERYAQAADDFTVVSGAGEKGKYWLHATYMLGWSRFKQTQLDAAANEFYQVVETTAGSEVSGQQELLDDALRVLMLTLEYASGIDTLAEDMRERQKPNWQYLVYQRLADEYLAQERYLDGVATWQLFVDENPLDVRAPSAHVGMIKTLIAADFPSEIAPKKREFVARYGARSSFWTSHPASVREGYAPELGAYLAELSQASHAKAQTTHARSDYLEAAQYYEQIVETFPMEPKLGDTLFLLGEVYTEAEEPESALAAYQRVVSDFPHHSQAADASYASILALDGLAQAATQGEQRTQWEAQRLVVQIDFATLFADDPRAPAVQAAAAQRLFEQGAFADASELAKQLLEAEVDLPLELDRTALLIVGHSAMELEEFAAAESAYSEHLRRIGPDQQVMDRLLASVYKQGELAEGNGETESAKQHYLRIAQLGPGSTLAAAAHFDAIAMVEVAGSVDQAVQLMDDFRRLYPADERARDIPVRLAALLESQNNYSGAAREYLKVARSSADIEQARQADYLAAELFIKDGDKQAGLDQLAYYTSNYPNPAAIAMEALDTQDQLLVELGRDQYAVWQAKVAMHDRMGKAADQRATYLAAEALFKLTNIERRRFTAIELSQPLKSSLKKKQRALKSTVAAYQKVASYGVADYVTAATYQIGSMYVGLSASIMDSQRPDNLNALQLEQYEILLEEQAYPFEEQAIEIHQVNLSRMWQGTQDEWVDQSLIALKRLVPGRFDKNEIQVAYVQTIH